MRKRREAEGTEGSGGNGSHGPTEKRRGDGKNEAYRRGGANEAPKPPAPEKLLGETLPPYVHDSVCAY
jgi:hypothetical protein